MVSTWTHLHIDLQWTILITALCATAALDCWAGEFSRKTCCDPSYGNGGNPSCWDGVYTYERCCGGVAKASQAPSGETKSKGVVLRRSNKIDGVVVGIDLGTTYSAVAVYRGGRAEVIPNDQGNRITPSVVAFLESGERLVGEAAKNQLADNPRNTIYDVKRIIGRGFMDRSVQMDKKSFPFRIVDRGGRPHLEMQKVHGGKKSLVMAPEEISAMVLQKMKASAEAYLGEEVRHAVVTVPAYFSDNQRSATMVAGEIAGLNIVRIINEPTAAAIAFGLQRQKVTSQAETKALVYDLGGGTFDVSILSVSDGVFQTLATCGNTHLGGEDFDRNVLKHMVSVFKEKTGKDPSQDRRAIQKLKVEVERAKRSLSVSVQTRVEVESFFQGLDFSEELSRSKFEHLNADLFSKTLEPVRRVLKDAGLDKRDIDEVVLVGGSTRIPKIKELIKDFFQLAKLPGHQVNPDEAVAAGAAIQGGILWQASAAGTAVGRANTYDLVLVDVTPLSLGIEIEGGHMVTIIPRNSQLPSKKSKPFSTVHDHQTSVYIPIYEGERPIAKKNNKLGQMILSGLPPAPAGAVQVEVTFRIDTNGILHVTAQDLGTKAAASVTINAEKGRLSEEEVERMVRNAQRHAEKDRDILARTDARAALRAYLHSLEASILQSSRLTENERSAVETAVAAASSWLQETGKATVEDIQEERKKVEKVVNPIVSRIYGSPAPPQDEEQENEERRHDEEEDGDYYDQDDTFGFHDDL